VLFSFLIRKSVFLPREIINFIFKMKKILLIASLLPAVMAFSQQYGGMWMPTELNEAEMKKLGMKISAKDIFNPNKPSIKDAVAQFNGGCTSEVISPKGLLLTNHHCGYNNIQSHSSVGNDLLTNGFWAKNMSEELPNPGVTADFIVDIKEVTDQVLNGTKGLTDREADAVIAKNIAEVTKQFKIEPYQKVTIKPMFAGNKYYAYIIETYKDVRLVGAPPQSIGKFGSDTDNWVWPRHTGDFALFRIYADKNNKPAEYSKDNVPYTPKHFLPISIKDIKENDFTFVFGFPGRTNEYLPSIAVEKIINDTNPAKIAVRDVALKTLDEKMRVDDATRIKYASKYASVANYWKKWIGETTGLKKSNAVQKKKDYEAFLRDEKVLFEKGFVRTKEFYYNDKLVELSYSYKGLNVDFIVYAKKENAISSDTIFYMTNALGNPTRYEVYHYELPFTALSECSFKEILVKVPENTREYISQLYGEDFEIPNTHYNWKENPIYKQKDAKLAKVILEKSL